MLLVVVVMLLLLLLLLVHARRVRCRRMEGAAASKPSKRVHWIKPLRLRLRLARRGTNVNARPPLSLLVRGLRP